MGKPVHIFLNLLRAPRAEDISFKTRSKSFFTSLSQNRRTRHPNDSNSLVTAISRARLRWNFPIQYLRFLVFKLLRRRSIPLSARIRACQKSPSMNTTTLFLAKTMSGRPASPLTFFRNRRPERCNALRTNTSVLVSALRIRDILNEISLGFFGRYGFSTI
jgi:hypothetical protein